MVNAWLVCLLKDRGVYICLEQSGGSLMRHHPTAEFMFEYAKVTRLWTYMGAFGNKIPKATQLFTNIPEKYYHRLKKSKPKKDL